jgi:hypothetical protein
VLKNKIALCVGINNYPGIDSDLSGCVNDAKDWSELLKKNGFVVGLLLDQVATRSNVLHRLHSMVAVLQPNDTMVFTFSGHGTQVPDENSDEPDGLDECLCCYDSKFGGLIYDDEIWKIFRSKKPGVKIVMISDSCHSGTVARKMGARPLLLDPDKQNGPPIARRKYVPYQVLEMAGCMPRGPELDPAARQMLSEEGGWLKESVGSDKVPWPLLLLSGCQDNEYSYDAEINHRPNGALTAYAISTYNNLPKDVTYRQWFTEIRSKLPNLYYPQTPRMAGSYIDTPALS